MRLLVYNPNTTQAVTDRMVEQARRHASADTEIVGLSAPRGVPYISLPEQAAAAERVTATIVAREWPAYDAIIIAAFADPGLMAARDLSPRPVLGIAESALLTASMMGNRFAIVSMASTLLPVFETMLRRLGLTERVVTNFFLDAPVADVGRMQIDHGAALETACRHIAARDAVSSIILGGGPLAGLADSFRARIRVPLLDGVACAIRHAETLVRLR
ncbi:MAG: Asp/Glu/hydantoin racemase [Alphaproteobacteria bacterium]|nr:Asp/Glu/hydantoin racemase [Alphaproteobacteria bacterium]